MAIIIKEKEKKLDWFPLGIGLFIIIVLALAVYFLFLAKAPLIEKLAPIVDLETEDTFDTLNDPSLILSNVAFSSLYLYVPNPDVGSLGKDNPFVKSF
ncbi:MAG TPA: hypothetical protein VJK04_02725 [Candidatus Paceibacterota bacterium]